MKADCESKLGTFYEQIHNASKHGVSLRYASVNYQHLPKDNDCVTRV
jgi:hypothetical protein